MVQIIIFGDKVILQDPIERYVKCEAEVVYQVWLQIFCL